MTGHPTPARADAARSEHGLSQEHRLTKGFTFRSAFALAFADVSPIVAIFAILALGLFSAGPAFWWTFAVVLAGMLLVAAVFGELASRWPYAGSVYQWSRHVHGTAWGWFTAWAYMWGLTIALSTLAFAASGFLVEIFGGARDNLFLVTVVALGLVVFGSLANIAGRKALRIMVMASVGAEIAGSVGLGTILLLFYKHNSLSVLWDGFGTQGNGSWLLGPGLLAMAYVGFSFLGFEAAGSIAEEVDEPERNVPKAIILSLLMVGLIVMYSSAALILSIPDLKGLIARGTGDPLRDTLTYDFGAGIGRPLLILFVIGFLSSFLAVQAAVSRCVWGSARDGSLPASRILDKLAGPERLPVFAIGLTGMVAAVFVIFASTTPKFYGVLVNFTTIGFYVAFGFPVAGAALSRLRGTWTPGPFSLGRWGAPITYAATLWLIAETINVAWPREIPGNDWYVNWAMIITLGVVSAVGIVVYAAKRNTIKAPIGERLAAERAELLATTPTPAGSVR